ncbi:transcriptional regulator, LysR family [Burkholderia sp. lig30]|jgi:DNA-binding transcriptional LysR family regulator|uniref:LysR family transcriptional regulator n=1 Tax=Burkholderia sp. lig30 TaxID=1192124 RepID=UPI0004618B76|nr:LysR family transcriptional regulator [Burkholderia sp. lig30]KDB10485.1 transcriptional regulator, LysR family [Burkholderia sp. lig30]
MDLSRIDLNLLVSLDVLLAECNVTKAAARLHISQPALSAQLARLRDLFGDPLLVPLQKGRGMSPTARALALHGPLRSALKTLGAVMQTELTFDPMKDERVFRVALGDNAMSAVGAPLAARVASQAGEKVRVVFNIADPERIARFMEEGEFDILIDSERAVPARLISRVLRQEDFVMAQRKRHPRGKQALDVASYCAMRHVVVSPDRDNFRGYMDDYLERLGKRRNTVLAVPQAMMIPDILQASDCVCTLPRMLLARCLDVVDVFALPFQTEPYRLSLAWHPRNDTDPAVIWLREQIVGLEG